MAGELVQCVACGHCTLRRADWERPEDARRMARAGFGKCLARPEYRGAGTYLSVSWPRGCDAFSPISPQDTELRARFYTPTEDTP